MRKVIFIGNWKTYKTSISEVDEWCRGILQFSPNFKQEHEFVICPSYIHLPGAAVAVPTNIMLGAQGCSANPPGPHTGEITAAQLATLGVKYCVIGHVEKRAMGETDEQINREIKACQAAGITPIVCFGETLIEYDNDKTRVVIERQMRDCLLGVRNVQDIILCYMPIWSIGTGFYTTGEYSNIIADFMRKTAAKLTGNPMSANCTIVFGGQITHTNAKEYMECPEIDGVMFAIAALDPKDYSEIAQTEFTTKKLLRVEHDMPKEKKGLFGK
ncbi:MAG: triose-phosphate isomerase [Firmicutes bacterium]|nr:triose-phosphate isomerase [Bacillota bacterium]